MAAVLSRTPIGEGLATGSGGPIQALSKSFQASIAGQGQVAVWSRFQIKALDRPPGKGLKLPLEQKGRLPHSNRRVSAGWAALNGGKRGLRAAPCPARLNKQPPEDISPSAPGPPVPEAVKACVLAPGFPGCSHDLALLNIWGCCGVFVSLTSDHQLLPLPPASRLSLSGRWQREPLP